MAETRDPDIAALARELDLMRRQIRALSRGSGAAFRSVELGDGQPKYYEPTSPTPISEVVNEDGVAVVKPVKPPVPPVPTQPVVESAIDGINVKWDGTFIGANRPQSLRYIEIHVSFDPFFEPRDSTQVGTMVSAFGGTVFIRRPPEEGPVWVGLTAVDIIGQESAMSSTAEGLPLPAGQVDEPQVPDDAPQVVAVPLGIGGILASWEPVPEATSYEVYVSTSPIIAFEITELLGEGPATSLAIGMLPDGSNLPYQPIYIRVRPKSDAGIGPASAEVTATPRKATTADVAADYVYAGQVSATQVTSGNLNAVVALVGELTVGAATGRRIVLNPTGGFQVIDAEGQVLVNFPTEVGSPNVFSGDGVFQGITALGRASFRGNDNEISRNSSFTLASGTTRPANAPILNLTPGMGLSPGHSPAITRQTFSNIWQEGDWIYQLVNYTGASGSHFDEAMTQPATFSSPADRHIIGWKWVDGPSGAVTDTPLPAGYRQMYWNFGGLKCSFVRVGTNWVVIYNRYMVGEATNYRWRAFVMNAAGALVSGPVVLPQPLDGAGLTIDPVPGGITVEGTNIGVYTWNTATSKLDKRVVNPSTGAQVGVTVSSPVIAGKGVGRIYQVGNYDKGSSRLPVLVQNTDDSWSVLWLNPTTLAVFATETADLGVIGAMLYHPTENRMYGTGIGGFFSNLDDPLTLIKYSKNTTEDYVWVAYSWYDSDPGGTGVHETTLSPAAYVQRKKYHVLQARSPVAPADAGDVDSPNSYRLYIATGTEEPVSEAAYRLTTTETGWQFSPIQYIDADYTKTTTPPPTLNTFPDGNAGEILSGIGGFILRGDGTGEWPYLKDAIVEELGGGVPGGGGGVTVQPDEPVGEDEGHLWFDEDEPNVTVGVGVWQDWTPVLTAETGAIGAQTPGPSRFCRIGNTCHWNLIVTINTVGTAGGAAVITMPLPIAHSGGNIPLGHGVEAAATGKMLGVFRGNATQGRIKFYDFATPFFTGASIQVGGTYEVVP